MKKTLLLLLTLVMAVSVWATSYKLVENAPSNWAGNYLLVAVNNSNYYSWDGTFGSWGTCAEVEATEISQDKKTITLSASSTIEPVKIAAVTGGYTIYGNEKYIAAADKKFNSSETTVVFGYISLNNDGTVAIQKTNNGSNDYGIRYNHNNGSGGFRVYKTHTTANAFYLYKEETTTPTVAYTVAFNAGTNGTCSTASLTEASAGAGVTLPSCTANAGYKFLGWTATQGNTTVDTNLTAGKTYKPSANTTLYAVYGALYQVTIEEPANGTLAVTYGENDVTSGSYYAVGEKINIVATPNDGYKFRNIQVVDATTHTFTASNEKEWEMGDHNITISANFDEIVYRTIRWSVNGNTSDIAPTQVENGTNITFPTGLADIYGKKFMGWSAKEDASSATDLVSGDVAASADATYYAVFADFTQGSQSTATLTNSATSQSSSYSEFTDTDSKGNIWSFKAYNATQKINNVSHYYYQISSNANNYHISSPTFSGNVKSVKVWAWNTSGSNRSAYLCSSTETAQPTSGDLGSLTIDASTKNSELKFTLDDKDFTQFNIYASAAIGFEKIEVTYGEDDVIENYTTKPVPTFASLDDLIAADQSYEAVNVTIDDKVFAAVAPREGAYAVVLTNSQVTLASSGENLGWLAGGTVTGTLTNVSWDNEHKALMSQKPFWSDLDYIAPQVQEFASIDELLAANLAHGTTVTVTVNGTITEVREVEGDGAYVVVLDNKFSIGSRSSELNWKVGGTVSGKLENVIFGTDEDETGVVSASENLFLILDYVAPAEPTTATITLNEACTDGEMVYGTYSNEKAFVVSDDIIVYEIMLVDGAIMKEAYKTSDVVPANTGVLVAANEAGNYEVELADEKLASMAESVLGDENALRASGAGITAADMEEDGDNYYYRLTMQNGSKIGFWWGATDGAAFDLDANKAYLVAQKSEGAAKGFAFGGTPTIIDAINAAQKVNGVAYNLNGQRVAANAKGIVIINGNKYINK